MCLCDFALAIDVFCCQPSRVLTEIVYFYKISVAYHK